MMEVYVLKAIRFDNSVSLTTGEWRHQPSNYEVVKGNLIESKEMVRNNVKTLTHIVEIDGTHLFFEEIFKTQTEAETRRKELLGYVKPSGIRIQF
jgi:hypothetical protein